MSSSISDEYRDHLLPKRLLFFDLDGTIISSTGAKGRRIAICISIYDQICVFAKSVLGLDVNFPKLSEEQCSEWYQEHRGPRGLITRALQDTDLPEETKNCLSYYFEGLFKSRLIKYLKEDLAHDFVLQEHYDFLKELAPMAYMVLVSYRYQTQLQFSNCIEELGLGRDGLFGPNNAFAVGAPDTSSDGSKARFVGAKWRNEIRAQRRLTSAIGKSFPPIAIGDSVRDLHFAVDIGGIFFGVSETGEYSRSTLVSELKKHEDTLSTRSRIFDSLSDTELKNRLIEECKHYQDAVKNL